MAARRLPVFVEPFLCRRDRRAAALRNDLGAEAVTTSIAIASGLGGTSAYTWLKVPVTEDPDDMARVMETSTLPAVLLGGEVGRRPGRARTRSGAGRCGCPPCRGWWSGARCSTRRTATWPRAVDTAVGLL